MAIKVNISKIVKFTLVLLLGIGIGIVGAAFLINKPFVKETELNTEANSEGKSTKEKKVDKSNVKRLGYIIDGTCSSLYLTKSGEVYVSLYGKTVSPCDEYATEYEYETFPGVAGDYKVTAGEGKDIETFNIYTFDENNRTDHLDLSMKVKTSGIVNAYHVMYGQAFTGDNYVLIDDKGNVSWFNIDFGHKKKVTGTIISNLEGCEGVVAAQTIAEGDGIGVVFIKEDGSHIDMTERVASRISAALSDIAQ